MNVQEPESLKTSVAVLGATGSIGTATMQVLDQLGAPWRAVAISAHSRIDELREIAEHSHPKFVAATGLGSSGFAQKPSWVDRETQFLAGPESLVQIAELPEVETVVAAVVGSAGVSSTLAAAQAGKRLALANKEALVVAGRLVTDAVLENGGDLLPVDSEHSAIFQALQSGEKKQLRKVILTASGGPFRTWPKSKLATATVDDALQHPTWKMGRKITIDSATMMNKALEIIEARWLFDLTAEQIDVVVHPQSIVHSMVEFVDGSVISQMSPPDMRLPIQYALTYPNRSPCPCPKMDWSATMDLHFEPADRERFPALDIGFEVAKQGGTCGCVVNAANEAAVELFLQGRIKFTEIVDSCQRILKEHDFDPNPTLAELQRQDRWAREEIQRWVAVC